MAVRLVQLIAEQVGIAINYLTIRLQIVSVRFLRILAAREEGGGFLERVLENS